VIIEGVGASRPGLRDLVDATVYIRANLSDIERRSAARVRSGS
jgi:pantothenate kinase